MKKLLIFVMCGLIITTQIAFHPPEEERKETSRTNSTHFISTGTRRSHQVGIDMLHRGGSAVDAALSSALHYIVEDLGTIVSFAGIFMLVYYEASTGRVYSLNACFKTPLQETQPLTIPTTGFPNARAVMVPGFMAGVQTAHDRFGKVPFAELFTPAIELAENGFPLPQWRVQYIYNHWSMLGVLPETRNIFLKRRYGLFRGVYEPGDTFTQAELAETLRQVASQGASYMYTGEWGRRFVEIVRREGGQITNQDMENYSPVWADPAHTTYNGYDIYALGYPSLGAMSVVLSVNLMECANLDAYDHCSSSAEALYRLIYCSRAAEFFYPPYAPDVLKGYIPEGDFTYESRGKKENARLIWEKIQSPEWPQIERAMAQQGFTSPGHSEAIISVDGEGNIAAICHTINVDNWGNTGIFVDGVSIPGAGSEQRHRVAKVGPGAYLPDTTNPLLVLRNGKPVIASSCIGSDLHCATVQNLYNMLTFDMSASQSTAMPKFQAVDWQYLSQTVQRNVFSQSLIDAVQAMGINFTFVDYRGDYWIGLRFIP